MKSILAGSVLLVGMIGSATAAEYYVVRGPDRKCTVVESKPRDTTIIQVGPLAFTTRDEAERQVRVLCRDDYDRRNDSVVIEREVRRERF